MSSESAKYAQTAEARSPDSLLRTSSMVSRNALNDKAFTSNCLGRNKDANVSNP